MTKRHISLDKVLTGSWEQMVRLLFKPFEFERWLILGVCAWMVMLVYDLGSILGHFFDRFSTDPETMTRLAGAVGKIAGGTEGSLFERIIQETGFAAGTLYLIAGAYGIYLLLCVVLYWVRCRFEFVLLANLLRGTGEIRKPWREFRAEGNSYFWWTLLISCAVFAVNMAFLAGTAFQAVPWVKDLSNTHQISLPGTGLWCWAGAWMVVALILNYYCWFFYQLLIPIMYRDKLTFGEGIRIMNRLFWKRFWICFLFYLVMMIVICGFIVLVAAASCVTCCIFFLLLTNVPYVRALLVLPLWVFYRLIGVAFLEELDPREPEPGEGSIEVAEPAE